MKNSSFIWMSIGFLGVSLALFMAACSKSPVKNNCLPYLTPVGFPHGSRPIEALSLDDEVVPKNWIPILSEKQIQFLQISYVGSMVARSNNEIWFVGYGPKPSQVVRYLVQSKEISTYKIELSSGQSYVPGDVYQSRSGELWGINPVNVTPGLSRGNYLLSKYNDATGKFLPFPHNDGIQLGGRKIKDIDSDFVGNLWLVVYGEHNNNFLVKVDVQTSKMTHIKSLESFAIISLTVDDQDRIWLFARTNENTNIILQYDALTNEVKDYGSPPIEEANADTQEIFVDHNDHLWVSNRAWLDIDANGEAVWYTVILPAAFVASSADPFGGISYQWWYDSPMIEDHQGRLWFGYPTIVSLNSERSEWCLIHRTAGVISEDDAGNIWIFSGGKLYKYEFQPK